MVFNSFGSLLIQLPRWLKKLVVLIFDATLAFLTTWLAFCLRFDELIPFSAPLLISISASLIIFIPIFIRNGLYRAIYRYSGWFAAIALIRAFTVYAAAYFFIFTVFSIDGVPRSVGLIQPVLFFISAGILRLFAKAVLNRHSISISNQKPLSLALIYGAGAAGRQLAAGLRHGNEIKPFAFIDDNPAYWNSSINGLYVYPPTDIEQLLQSGVGITDILLAIPAASRLRQKEILEQLAEFEIKVRILPGLSKLANGIVKVEDVRAVEIDDVLGRDPVVPNPELLSINITGKVVLVTGAGGSIGSELCRQILALKPSILVLFELSEFALYAIERELSYHRPDNHISLIPVLGSVLDSIKLRRLCRKYEVKTVFHAAAYKHVPMIEANPAAGVWNNVFGTLRLVEAVCLCNVDTFVLVSTDKAVRPTNVMGCSKRLAELVLQAKTLEANRLGIRTPKLTMVRFGNVLGSSGSVVPLFREQIKNGGPVTVTHPDIIRYFMTIPEAAQLVIQASAMGTGGDVMVLDMGKPVKIVDLAQRMIHLSGFTHKDENNPRGDIEIQFTGLRPGEKLYEELLIGDNTLTTDHPRIMRAGEHCLVWEELEPLLYELEAAVKTENEEVIRKLLKRAVPEFCEAESDF